MDWKAGARFKSAVCSVEGVVVRPPAQAGELACGTHRVLAAGDSADAAALEAPQTGAALPGKRYVDEPSGLEVLCTKPGKGAFSFAGRPLELKVAKALPASD